MRGAFAFASGQVPTGAHQQPSARSRARRSSTRSTARCATGGRSISRRMCARWLDAQSIEFEAVASRIAAPTAQAPGTRGRRRPAPSQSPSPLRPAVPVRLVVAALCPLVAASRPAFSRLSTSARRRVRASQPQLMDRIASGLHCFLLQVAMISCSLLGPTGSAHRVFSGCLSTLVDCRRFFADRRRVS